MERAVATSRFRPSVWLDFERHLEALGLCQQVFPGVGWFLLVKYVCEKRRKLDKRPVQETGNWQVTA